MFALDVSLERYHVNNWRCGKQYHDNNKKNNFLLLS